MLAREHPFSLMILNVILPDFDGLQVIRRLRGEGCVVPVIFRTARDTRPVTIT